MRNNEESEYDRNGEEEKKEEDEKRGREEDEIIEKKSIWRESYAIALSFPRT